MTAIRSSAASPKATVEHDNESLYKTYAGLHRLMQLHETHVVIARLISSSILKFS